MNGLMVSDLTLSLTRLRKRGDGQGFVGFGEDLLFNATLIMFMNAAFPYPWLED